MRLKLRTAGQTHYPLTPRFSTPGHFTAQSGYRGKQSTKPHSDCQICQVKATKHVSRYLTWWPTWTENGDDFGICTWCLLVTRQKLYIASFSRYSQQCRYYTTYRRPWTRQTFNCGINPIPFCSKALYCCGLELISRLFLAPSFSAKQICRCHHGENRTKPAGPVLACPCLRHLSSFFVSCLSYNVLSTCPMILPSTSLKLQVIRARDGPIGAQQR